MFRNWSGFRIAGLLVMGLMLFSLVGCSQSASSSKKTVVIGVSEPLTGQSASDGNVSLDGVKLALQDAEAKMPALAAYNIQLDVEDDATDPTQAASIANKFASEGNMLAVIGCYTSSCTLAEAPILIKAGIPIISFSASSPKLTGFSNYLFRTVYTDAVQAVALCQWATQLGYKKAAILYEDSDFGLGNEQVYKKAWTGPGQSVVLDKSYLSTTMDYTPELTAVKASGADCVLLGSLYNEVALMMKQAQTLGLKVAWFGAYPTQGLFDLGPQYVEGLRMCADFVPQPNPNNPLVAPFLQEFQQKYPNVQNNMYGAQSYDAMMLILTGLAQNGPDRSKLDNYLLTVKDFPGIIGKITFVKGDPNLTFDHVIIHNGQFVLQP